MGEVTKVTTTRDYALFEQVYPTHTVFYISSKPYRRGSLTEDKSDVYALTGKLLGTIRGYWFDFAQKTLFKQVEDK